MISHRPSHTAIVVAKSQALAEACGPGFPQPGKEAAEFSKRVLHATGHGLFARVLKLPLFRRALNFYESFMIPGLARHHVLRKKAIEKMVLNALKSGVKQVVQIGAGFDSLCLRLHSQWPEVNFYEFDHPATQKLKQEILNQERTGKNLVLKPLDLSDPDSNALSETISLEIPTLFIIEGVLMYLPLSLVTIWFQKIRELVDSGSRLIFTFMEQARFTKQSFAVHLWLKLVKEPFRWHASPSSVRSLLRENDWKPSGEHATWLHSGDEKAAAGEWIDQAES
jgi:methyltransferase (TIGR00027 family)